MTTGPAPACAGLFEVTLATGVAAGDTVTATATSPAGSTSRFTAPVAAVPIVTAGPTATPDPVAALDAVQLGVGVHALVAGPTYAWTASCPEGVGDGRFDDPGAAAPTWIAPRLRARGGASMGCEVAVTVGNGAGVSETAAVAVTVVPRSGSGRGTALPPAPGAGRTGAVTVGPAPGPGGPAGPGVRASTGGGAVVAYVAALPAGPTGTPHFVLGAGPGQPPEVHVVRAAGDGLATVIAVPAYEGGAPGVRVAACDLDGDGEAEVITGPGPGAPPVVRVWAVGLEGGRLVGEGLAGPAEDLTGRFVACGDLDGDGRAEVVVGTDAAGAPWVGVLRLEAGGLTAGGRVELAGAEPGGGVRVAAADLDGDGRAEVVVAPGPGGGPGVLILDGLALLAGARVERARVEAGPVAGADGLHVAAGDFDGDGRADLAVAGGPAGPLTWRVLDPTLALAPGPPYDPAATAGVALPLLP